MKRILLVAAVLAVFSTVKAQDFKFGAKAGVNFANLRSEDETADARTSIHFGVVAEYKLSDQFAVQPELLFSGQGAKDEDTITESGMQINVKETLKLSYLNLPVMFKYYAAKGFSLQAGPQLGVLLSSKAKAEAAGMSHEEDMDGVKTIDFGFNFGLGYKFNEKFFVDARYNLGLSNIAKEEGDAKNGVFQISVGYMF